MAQAAALEEPSLEPMTLEAWADMDEDEPGELVDGYLVEEEVPSFLHESVVSWLIYALRGWAMPRGGWVFGSEAKFGVAKRRGRKPDVSMYLPGARLPVGRAGIARRPPSVLIEVVSPRPRDIRRDRVEKVGDYARFGVRFYWLLDPQTRVLEILELSERGRYEIALTASEGTHDVPGCEGLTLDLDALWAEMAKLPEEDDEPTPDEDAP
jgi:Uma2 family endonuclease